tara:strand:- start:147 stop:422 length:276 start_codon:yes stop_codon:yes gene_type:complete
MSSQHRAQAEALRSRVDPQTAAFIDASLGTLDGDILEAIKVITDLTARHENLVQALTLRIVALESNTITSVDDKYSLTREKLVRLMKDMGY